MAHSLIAYDHNDLNLTFWFLPFDYQMIPWNNFLVIQILEIEIIRQIMKMSFEIIFLNLNMHFRLKKIKSREAYRKLKKRHYLISTYLESRFVITSYYFGKLALNFVCRRFSQNTQECHAICEKP